MRKSILLITHSSVPTIPGDILKIWYLMWQLRYVKDVASSSFKMNMSLHIWKGDFVHFAKTLRKIKEAKMCMEVLLISTDEITIRS